jgi:hypothetical protein
VTILRKKFSPPVEMAARTSKVLLMIVSRISRLSLSRLRRGPMLDARRREFITLARQCGRLAARSARAASCDAGDRVSQCRIADPLRKTGIRVPLRSE